MPRKAVLKIQTKEKLLKSDYNSSYAKLSELAGYLFWANGRNSEDGKDLTISAT
jgi:hypothetical protein